MFKINQFEEHKETEEQPYLAQWSKCFHIIYNWTSFYSSMHY